MQLEKPDFLDSPYFVGEPGNWRLCPGAPKEVVEEFKAFMALLNMGKDKPKDSKLVKSVNVGRIINP